MPASPHNFLVSTYKHKDCINIKDLPIEVDQRICTDVCCTISTTLFALIMIGIAIGVYDPQRLARISYPTDGEGRLCTLDNQQYDYLYFSSFDIKTKRLCVSQCPNGTENQLKCWPMSNLSCKRNNNSEFEVAIYPSQASDTSLGLFCFPKDKTTKDQILRDTNLLQREQFLAAFRSIGISAIAALVLGFLFLLLVLMFPKVTVFGCMGLGGLGCLIVSTLLIIKNTQLLQVYESTKLVFCIILILVGMITLFSIFSLYSHIQLCLRFISQASVCLGQFPLLITLIFIFYALLIGLFTLCGLQLLAYWSYSQLQWSELYIYYYPQGTFQQVMTVMCGVQFIWGLCFLKQTFNFLVTGTAVWWYFKEEHSLKFSIYTLFHYHWGSVVAGSFLTYFFYIPDLFYDFIKPSQSSQKCYPVFTSFCCCCERLFGLARNQSLVFVHLTGIPYCNAARRVQRIDYLSSFFDGSESIYRSFRIGAHVLLSMCATVCAYAYMMIMEGEYSILALIFSFIINIFIITFFVSLIGDTSEAIFMCTLVEKYINMQDQHDDREGEDEGYILFHK